MTHSTRLPPARRWLAVTLVSVFGTLVTDNMSDAGVALETSTLIFAVLLTATFLAWYASERTLSIHSILTRRREAFYWTTVSVQVAPGKAAPGQAPAAAAPLGDVSTFRVITQDTLKPLSGDPAMSGAGTLAGHHHRVAPVS